jgi:hypothetical protein
MGSVEDPIKNFLSKFTQSLKNKTVSGYSK